MTEPLSTFGVSWTAAGHAGGAVDFNGSGWVTVADHADLDLRSTMTIEAWVKPRSHSRGRPS